MYYPMGASVSSLPTLSLYEVLLVILSKVFIMYYAIGTSVSSLHNRESTDSLIFYRATVNEAIYRKH